MALGVTKRKTIFSEPDTTNVAGGTAFDILDASQRLLHIDGRVDGHGVQLTIPVQYDNGLDLIPSTLSSARVDQCLLRGDVAELHTLSASAYHLNA